MKKSRKNTAENNDQSELIPPPKSTKPIASKFATTTQLISSFPFLAGHVDETFLRNRAREINPRTGAPWIPKPRNNQFEITPTIHGLLEWFATKSERAKGLPDFATMELCESAGHIPRTMQKWAQKRGVDFLKKGHRVDFEALLRGLNEKLFTPMFSGDTSKISALGIGGLAAIDGQYEEDRLTRERADEQAMLNAEKRGELLFSRDQQLAVNELHATEILFEQFLAPFKKELLDRAKREDFYDTITDLLDKHMKHLPPEQRDGAVNVGKKKSPKE